MASGGIQTLNPESLGPAIAPYSQATVANGFCFIAGQVALDSENNVIAPGDARAQTVAAVERMETILGELGATLNDVVTATVFITNLDDFAAFNEGWTDKFGVVFSAVNPVASSHFNFTVNALRTLNATSCFVLRAMPVGVFTPGPSTRFMSAPFGRRCAQRTAITGRSRQRLSSTLNAASGTMRRLLPFR